MMIEPDYTRQLDLCSLDALRRLVVDIVGAGGIGGWVCLALVKLGLWSIRVWDFDVVDAVNVPSQVYSISQASAGMPKVEALRVLCRELADVEIEAVQERVTCQRLRPFIISGLDSMAARRDLWAGAVKGRPVDWYIDARMGGDTVWVVTVRPTSPVDISVYEETLYSDEDALPLRCTDRAIVSWPLAAAALVVRQVVTITRGEEPARLINVHLGRHPFIQELE